MSVQRPNIILILADDLGYADLSCYGRRDYETPNLDRLAEGGVRFLQSYANSPVCSATRTALITGRYQYRLTVGLEEPINPTTPGNVGIPPEQPTLPSILRDGGYATGLIGKWHLGRPPEFGPRKSGYEYFYGMLHGSADYFRHAGPSAIFENEMQIEAHGYKTNLFGDRAVEFIERSKDDGKPFFLSLHFNAPHWPWEGPGDEAESKRIKTLRHHDGGSLKVYANMVQALDENVGRVMQTLDAHGLSDNTIVVFTSDNGGERFSDMWPFAGEKGELLEGGLRIPTIVRWPARLPAGRDYAHPGMSMDWMPTLLAAAGLKPHPDYPLDGVDLLPSLAGEAATSERTLFWRYKAGSQAAVLRGNWKYLSIGGNEFLFDVAIDQRERANLKERYPDKFAQLKGLHAEWNATMLPERSRPASHSFSGDRRADRHGFPPSDNPE